MHILTHTDINIYLIKHASVELCAHHCCCCDTVWKCGSTVTLQLLSLSRDNHQESQAMCQSRLIVQLVFAMHALSPVQSVLSEITNLIRLYLETVGPPWHILKPSRTDQ